MIGIEISDPKVFVVYKSFKFDHYEIKNDNGRLFLIGTNDEPKGIMHLESSESYDLLYSVLVLHKNLNICQYVNPLSFGVQQINETLLQEWNKNKKTPCGDLSHLLKFVKKFGFPYFKEYDNEDDAKNDPNKGNIFCNHFLKQSNELAIQDIMWDISPIRKRGKIDISLFIYCFDLFFRDLLNIIARYKNLQNRFTIVLNQKDKDRVKWWIENNIDEHLLDLRTVDHNRFALRWNDKMQCLETCCDNLMHLSCYYLALTASSGKYNDSGSYILRCKKCGKLFVTDNPRMKFCQDPCTRQAAYNKRKRSEEKM